MSAQVVTSNLQAAVLTVLLGAVCVVADCLLKRASCTDRPLTSAYFAIGVVLYSASAVGWVYLLRDSKLATIGAIYSMTVIVMLTAVGVFWYGERVSASEMLGLVMAIVATYLLSGRT